MKGDGVLTCMADLSANFISDLGFGAMDPVKGRKSCYPFAILIQKGIVKYIGIDKNWAFENSSFESVLAHL